MRIALVMCHAERRMEGARRELHLLRALGAIGVEVRFFRMHGGPAEEEPAFDGRVVAAFSPVDNPEAPPSQRVSTPMLHAIGSFRPDLVLYKGLRYTLPAFLQDRLRPVPDFGFIVGGAVEDLLLERARFVLAEHAAQAEHAFPVHHAAGRTMVLPKFFDAALCGDGTPHPEPRHHIINVGTFHGPRKNQAALLPLSRRYRVGFVGGGAQLEEVKAAAPPKSQARFHGHRPAARVYDYLRDSRIMVHPSLHEGLPRAVVEAMACGRPVVALRHVIPDGLIHGEHGLLVTPETLEAEVDGLLSDPARIKTMGRAAFLHAHAQHGLPAIEAAAEKLLHIVHGRG